VFADAERMRRNIMKKITAKEFDEKFDNGEDISEYLDFSKKKPGIRGGVYKVNMIYGRD